MLLLTIERDNGKAVMVLPNGDEIIVKSFKRRNVPNSRVVLGFDIPDYINVLREKLYLKGEKDVK